MFDINDIVRVTGGVCVSPLKPVKVSGVTIDSRLVKRGQMFIAIKGERFDGHQFVSRAIKQGAKVVVVSRDVKVPSNILVIKVKDTTNALGSIAQLHRLQFSIPVIGITGSTGKTTTKDLIVAVLKKKYCILSNVGTQNNHIGVPLTLLKLTKKHQVAVLEFGTNQFGDIKYLTKIAYPTMGVYTNIGHSHLEGLKNIGGVYREKLELIKNMEPKGKVVINADDAYLRKINQRKISQKIIRYGSYKSADFILNTLIPSGKSSIELSVSRQKYRLKTPAKHNAYNALAAIAVGSSLKVKTKDIKKALSDFVFSNGRFEIKQFRKITMINDSYNSNPTSLESAITTLNEFQTKGRRILVCADMLELGEKEIPIHGKVGRLIGRSGIDILYTYGSLSKNTSQAATMVSSELITKHFTSKPNLKKDLLSVLEPSDVVLIKGSRSMKMDEIVNFLSESKKGSV